MQISKKTVDAFYACICLCRGGLWTIQARNIQQMDTSTMYGIGGLCLRDPRSTMCRANQDLLLSNTDLFITRLYINKAYNAHNR